MLCSAFSVSAICAYVHFLLFLFKRTVYLYFHPAKLSYGKCSINKLYEVNCKIKQHKHAMHCLYEGQSCTCAAVKGHKVHHALSIWRSKLHMWSRETFKRWKLSMCNLYPFSSSSQKCMYNIYKISCNATFLHITYSFEKYATCVLYLSIFSQISQNVFRKFCRRKPAWERSSSPK